MSTVKTAAGPVGRPVLLDYWALTKPGVTALILTTGFMTLVVAADGLPPFPLLIATVLGTALASASANAFNMYFDRDIDAIMTRTKSRPLPARPPGAGERPRVRHRAGHRVLCGPSYLGQPAQRAFWLYPASSTTFSCIRWA